MVPGLDTGAEGVGDRSLSLILVVVGFDCGETLLARNFLNGRICFVMAGSLKRVIDGRWCCVCRCWGCGSPCYGLG